MKNYRIFDRVAKYYHINHTTESTESNEPLKFATIEDAEISKDEFLSAGNYIDRPHNSIEIHQFEDDMFIQSL